MFKTYFQTTFRSLYKNRTSSIINILGLALGISCCIVIYIMGKHELTFDHYHTDAEKIYKVVTHYKADYGMNYDPITPYPLPEALRNDLQAGENSEVEMVAQVHGKVHALITIKGETGENRKFQEPEVLYADQYYLQMFDFGKEPLDFWIEGNPKNALAEPFTVILTKKIAQKYFPNQSALGKILTLDKRHELKVIGVVNDPPRNTNLPFRLIISYQTLREINNWVASDNWYGTWQNATYIKLSDEANYESVFDQVTQLDEKYLNEKEAAKTTYSLLPLKTVHTRSEYGNGGNYTVPPELLFALILMGTFSLLTACINFINLATAQAVKRSKEVGVRKVLGGTRKGLVLQFLGETAILTLIGISLSLWISELALEELNDFLAIAHYDLHLDFSVVYFSIFILIMTTLLAGFYPALVLSKFNPINALRNRFHKGKKSGGLTLRRALVIFQFVFSQLLIIVTLVASNQINLFKNSDMGFAKDAIVSFGIPGMNDSRREKFRDDLMKLAAVEKMSYAITTPLSSDNNWNTDSFLKAKGEEEKFNVNLKHTDEHYFNLFELSMVAGESYKKPAEGDSTIRLVVNEAFVRKAGLKQAEEIIGEVVSFNGKEGEVIGVVKNFHNRSMHYSIKPLIMTYNPSVFYTASLKIQGKNIRTTLADIEFLYNENFPDDYFKYIFMDDGIQKLYTLENLLFNIFRVFSFISIFIGCLGLYGLVSFMAIQKSKEVGVRKVHGASISHIIFLFSKEFTRLVIIAFVVAAPIAYILTNLWLQEFTYKIELGAHFFLFGILISLGIAWVTVGYRSFRAAVVSPVKSLKDE